MVYSDYEETALYGVQQETRFEEAIRATLRPAGTVGGRLGVDHRDASPRMTSPNTMWPYGGT